MSRWLELNLLIICLSFYAVYGLDNGLGLTPPMGWSTWNLFGKQISDTLIREIATAMDTTGLSKLGYEYINIDDGWAVGRYPNGTIKVDPDLFPFGMKSLADFVHSKGLKLGIYTSRGRTTYLGRPGSLGYEKIDADTYADWGIDYLKEDSYGVEPTNETQARQYEIMRDSLNSTGRKIYFSICEFVVGPKTPLTPYGGVYTPKIVGGSAVKLIANSWLVEYVNMEDTWYSLISGGYYGLISNLDAQRTLTEWNYSGPGGWNDMDMMECCNGGMTTLEYKSHFSLWSILASPLILSNDLRKMTPTCMEIIGNPEVIAVNQDPLGIQAQVVRERVSSNGTIEFQIFVRPLKNHDKAVVLLNRMTTRGSFVLVWEDLGLEMDVKVKIRDLWAKSDLGVFVGRFVAEIEPHGSVMIRTSVFTD